ncbi:MAG TPA: serine/threonine-protein kinase, partial [Mycobacterium sp.]|nr:serine/threonine-protein kinase [Mycobacterium sp.]
MGEVHLARDTKMDRLVAIKLFQGDHANPAATDRFIREASLAGRLVNPHIVTIYDFGEWHGQLYIVMEYIAGDSLASLIARRRPRTLQEKLVLMIDLCAGLGYAHDAGVLHRDIKPGNLMLAASGLLKVVDFGVARALEAGGVTQPLLGSLCYMAPEQLALAPPDQRSDIFAVGAVFYELLSFRQAFAADSVEGVIERIRAGAPEPLSTLCPDLDPGVVAIVERTLEKDPDARYQDLHTMEEELRQVMRRLSDQATPTAIGHDDQPNTAAAAAETPPNVTETVAASSIGPVDPNNPWARAQRRLLEWRHPADYVAFA